MSDLKLCQVFEKDGFTVEIVTFNGTLYGSAKKHIRTWFVIWDISRRISDELGLPGRFHQFMNHMHLEKYPMDALLLSKDELENLFKSNSYGANMRSLKGAR